MEQGMGRCGDMDYLWVGIGGFLGANARFGLGRIVADRFGGGYPWSTFVVNLSGSFLIGILLTVLIDRAVANPLGRPFLVVGFLGGYTTFSSYTFEAVSLAMDGKWATAGLYVLESNVVGLIACGAGIALARQFAG